MNKIILGDCIEVMAKMEDESVDTLVTDPPAGINFMGKSWDHKAGYQPVDDRDFAIHEAMSQFLAPWEAGFLSFTARWSREAFRVLKPGAMALVWALPRTQDLTQMGLRFAGYEIRDSVCHIFGCLSDDTEILIDGEWKHYQNCYKGCLTLCYSVENDSYSWLPVEDVFEYHIEDTAYRIQSDLTDQIVSRNHRCIVEREGVLLFQLAEEAAQEHQIRVPVLESLPELRFDISMLQQVSSRKEQTLLRKMPSGEDQQSELWAKETASSMPDMREDVSTKEQRPIGQTEVLLDGMLREVEIGESRDTGTSCEDRVDGSGGMDGGKLQLISREYGRSEQSCLEGRRDLLQKEGQLQEHSVCQVSEGVLTDGSERRLHNGASVNNGSASGAMPEEVRSSPSYQPRSNRQPNREPDALLQQPTPQEIRGDGITKTNLATITPIKYTGVVWCVKVPTGAFVARRNGKIFVTGNSGFPKSHDISKAIDKMAGVERRVIATKKWKPGPTFERSGQALQGYRPSGAPYPSEINGKTYTIPATDEARLWDGYGTALKPAYESWILAMKPLDGTFANNALRHGVAGLWIDGGRVSSEGYTSGGQNKTVAFQKGELLDAQPRCDGSKGRFPANLILSHAPGCERIGERWVKGISGGNNVALNSLYKMGMETASPTGEKCGYADSDGMETVAEWRCVNGEEFILPTYEGNSFIIDPRMEPVELLDHLDALLHDLEPYSKIDSNLLHGVCEAYHISDKQLEASAGHLSDEVACALGLKEFVDFQGGYQSYHRLCDGLVRQILTACLEGPRPLFDALEHVHRELSQHVHIQESQPHALHSSYDDSGHADKSSYTLHYKKHGSPPEGETTSRILDKSYLVESSEIPHNTYESKTDATYNQRTSPRSAGISEVVRLLCTLSADLAYRYLLPALLIRHSQVYINFGVCPVAELDRQSGTLKSGGSGNTKPKVQGNVFGEYNQRIGGQIGPSEGGASRFFVNLPGEARFLYQAKASRAERNRGLEGMPSVNTNQLNGMGRSVDNRPGRSQGDRTNRPIQNHHPTVKPLALMRYLVRLTRTPTGGVVLDPFVGSGTTGMACVLEGREFIGIEQDPDYFEIAKRRLASVDGGPKQADLFKFEETETEA